MERGAKQKSRPVPALSETERLKMGALIPINISLVVLHLFYLYNLMFHIFQIIY